MLFDTALVRAPGCNFSRGITTANLGIPDVDLALRQHGRYVEALQEHGIRVHSLNPDSNYPDGCFVEDTAVVTPEFAVITNPGAPARQGEQASVREALAEFRQVFSISHPGTLEGGDVLRVEKEFFVGISGRTNLDGIRQFERIVGDWGYSVTRVPLDRLLHLKSGVAYIGRNTLICSTELSRSEEFRKLSIVRLHPEEHLAANCLRVQESALFIPSGHPRVREELLQLGYEVREMEIQEFQKMDGGLTCLSLLFTRVAGPQRGG